MVEIVEFAVKGQFVFGQAEPDHLERLAELCGPLGEVDAVEPDFDRRDAAPDPVQKTAAAHLVEHADLVDQPQRMVERQQVDHRAEAQLPGALRQRRQKDAGGRA